MTNESKLSNKKTSKKIARKKIIMILSTVFFVLGCIYLAYWFLVLRNHQSTDDAYVAGNQIRISSQVPGTVIRLNTDNTDLVKAGDTLVVLDPTDAEQVYERAKTALASSVRQTHQLMINSRALAANIAIKQTTLQQAQQDLQRREALGMKKYIGQEDLQHARDAVQNAQNALKAAIEQYNANQAITLNTPIVEQPAVKQAASQVRDAWLALQRTHILSPVTGYVSQRTVQVGTQIAAGSPLMAVIPDKKMWIEANFKETQLANMRIGQPATVISDLYGDKVVYKGTVVGIDMGTGSAFSLLPAQNATGNWIKVVQRLAVKIALDPTQLQQHPLRIGLSTRVSVDTKDRAGAVLAQTSPPQPLYQTTVLPLDLSPVNKVIEQIIQANAA